MSADLGARAVELFHAAWAGDIEGALAQDYLDHDAMPGLPPGPDGFRALRERNLEAFPDYGVTVEDVLVDGDKVCLRITNRGTNTGPLFGREPTGKAATWTTMTILRMEGDRIAERWGVIDRLGLLQQLGLI